MWVQHHLARPLQLDLTPCCRGAKLCEFCELRTIASSANHHPKPALYSSHAWIMVPVVVVDSWVRNPMLVDQRNQNHASTIGVNFGGERCTYHGVQSFVIQVGGHQHQHQYHHDDMKKSYGPQVVRFHVWRANASLPIPHMFSSNSRFLGARLAWKLRFDMEDQDDYHPSIMPGLEWKVQTNVLSHVSCCSWYPESDATVRRALTNANSRLDGTIPWVFVEYRSGEQNDNIANANRQTLTPFNQTSSEEEDDDDEEA